MTIWKTWRDETRQELAEKFEELERKEKSKFREGWDTYRDARKRAHVKSEFSVDTGNKLGNIIINSAINQVPIIGPYNKAHNAAVESAIIKNTYDEWEKKNRY